MKHTFGQLGTEPHIPTVSLDERTIGRILMDMGKLKSEDIARIFTLHREKGLRFGEAARLLRLVTDADVQYALSIQFNYPYLRSGQGVLGSEVIAAHHPFVPQAEVVRDLRTRLLLHWFNSERRALAIISPYARDGRTYLAANLAVAFSQLGEKTLLIDADLRAPRQHRIFGLVGGVGLSQVLSGRAEIDAAEPIPYFENLVVLAAGAAPPNPLEMLSRPEFPQLIAEAEKRFTVIIIDTSADARGSDATIVSARARGVLMLARQDETRVSDLQRLGASVSSFGAHVVGTVLNRM